MEHSVKCFAQRHRVDGSRRDLVLIDPAMSLKDKVYNF